MEVIPTLVCLFKNEDIKFRTFTLKSLQTLTPIEIANKIEDVYEDNLTSLQTALDKCFELGIKSYRISSNLFPKFSYVKENNLVPQGLILYLETSLRLINTHNIILSIHPDQFVVMNSHKDDVVKNSVLELKYHLWLAEYIKIDSINIHVGGLYNDRANAMRRFIDNMNKYFSRVELNKFTLENDEKSFSAFDVLDICLELQIRPTFDIHHYRCYNMKQQYENELIRYILIEYKKHWVSSGFNYMQVHLSSPRDDNYLTLKGSSPHADFIHSDDYIDFSFLDFNVVIDIEAKAKEIAVLEFKDRLILN